MKKRLRIFCITMLLTILLSVLFIAPVLGTDKTEAKSEKERAQAEIENGFSYYLTENRISTNANRTRAFSAFLRTNPAFQEKLSEYTNLTIKEHETNIQSLQLSGSTVGPIFKTVNTTIDGTDYKAQFRRGICSDGTEFVRINLGCNGTDPEYYVDYYYLSIAGINYGEVSTLDVHFLADNNEALNWKQNFDTTMDNVGTFQRVVWAIGGIALTAAGGPAGAIAGVLVGVIPELNRNHLKTTVDNAYSSQNGIRVKWVSTYIYPICITPLSRPDFQIFAYQGSSWVLAYPYIDSFYLDLLSCSSAGTIALLEANAWAINHIVKSIGSYFNDEYGTWHQFPDPPTPSENPPSGAGILKEVTWNSYDTTGSTYVSGADIQLDDHSLGTTTSSAYYLTPEEHVVWMPHVWSIFAENYQFTDYGQYGSENEIIVETTSDTTITANYAEMQWLYVNAYETTSGMPVGEADIYIDSQWAGQGAVGVLLPKGSHSVWLPDQLVHNGELVTLDYIVGDTNFYLGDTPVYVEFWYRWGY